MKLSLPILFFLLLLYSCNNNTVFESIKEFPDRIWTYDDTFTSEFSIKNDTVHYDIYFGISHNENYPFQNIYLKITDNFTGSLNADTINIDLYDKSGMIKGKKYGSNYHLNTLLRKSFLFPKSGNYNIKIEQFTRKDSLEGVTEVDFLISK